MTTGKTDPDLLIPNITLPPGRTTADFIKLLSPVGGPGGYVLLPPPPAVDPPLAGAVTFTKVTPGTRVRFNVKARNDFVQQTNSAQYFSAKVAVTAEDGCFELDEREVVILVPPRPMEVPW
ncbi:MAG: hypothetical protein FWD57_09120 [Polyangiaceae bacterium]|nr:hypothetical protein [Polyangiaceae bacterium]